MKELIKNYETSTILNSDVGISNLSKFYRLPTDLFLKIQEQVTFNSTDDCINNKVVKVVPKTYDEYNIQIKNPFRKPDSNVVWRLDYSKQNGIDNVELLSIHDIKKYQLRYIKFPSPIILSPLLLGVKIDITEEKNGIPEIALIGHVFPIFSASQDYRPETTAIDFRFSLSHTLNEKSSIGYNIGAQWGDDSSDAAAIYTVAYGYSLTDKFGAYAELYGDLPEDSSANHYWDAGFTYLVSNNIQLDTYFGTSITKGQDILIGLGASFRIPTKQN